MMTLQQVIKKIQHSYPDSKYRFLHPSLYIICSDPAFKDKSEEYRLELAAGKMEISTSDLEYSLSSAGVSLVLGDAEEIASSYEFLEAAPSAHHWLEYLIGQSIPKELPPPLPVVHFYGYKGGQGRSTVLTMFAQQLAEDGYKVLVLDADIEAPSLQTLFDGAATTLESTLYGCVHFDLTPEPVTVFVPKIAEGRIDLIACRPNDRDYDLDAANFALRTALDPQPLQKTVGQILKNAAAGYDVVLIDHRTGLSASVIPLAASFPGPVVICLRLDEQSDRAEAYFDVLFRLNPSNPGLFVSFSLDPEESANEIMGKHQDKITSLLQSISDSLREHPSNSPEDDEFIDTPEADDLLSYWIPWFHDRNFFGKKLPAVSSILSDNQKSLTTMREILRFSKTRILPIADVTINPHFEQIQLSGSGNRDAGPLIEAEALRQLRLPSTPFLYILGRKGTGKTRLLRALAEEGKGKPILVADDYPHEQGLLSNDTLLTDLATQCKEEPVKLWWALLDSALSSDNRSTQRQHLQKVLQTITQHGPQALSLTTVREKIVSLNTRQIMLIDGVETAFSASQTSLFVEGLFRFLSTLQTDSLISQKLTVRVFIRTDLVEGARENIEQQLENRVIKLAWDTQTILNFVLARIGSIQWFKDEFPLVNKTIQHNMHYLVRGSFSEEQCSGLLLQIFPEKIRRNNIGTLTFLKNYFSDGQGDKASFYPRVYDSFLSYIANGGPLGTVNPKPQLENESVAQDLIFEAHAYACKDYLSQVKDELKNMLNLDISPQENIAKISDLLGAFNGMLTPFNFDDAIKTLDTKIVPSIPEADLRKSLLQMKRIGIFEDRPDYPREWRVGRLFKSSLGMRYNRKRKDEITD